MTKSQGPNSFAWALDIGAWGFHLVPRDDRLFDVFPHLTREHGVELWEKWTPDTIELILIHFQNPRLKSERISIPRQELEQRLLRNQRVDH